MTGQDPEAPPRPLPLVIRLAAMVLALALAFATGFLTACASRHPAPRPAVVTAPAPAPVTSPDDGIACRDIKPVLSAVLEDLRQADADHREAWIQEGYSHDLASFAHQAEAASGTGKLNRDARQASTAASGYLAENTDAYGVPSRAADWLPGYEYLRVTLNVLARDCQLPPAWAPTATTGTGD